MKHITKILAIILAVLLLSLPITASAEGENIDTSDVNAEETTMPETEATPDTVPPSADTVDTGEDVEGTWDKILDKLTSSTMWISVGTYAVSAFALYELIKKRFSGVISLIKDKSDTKTIISAVSDGYTDIKDKFDERVETLTSKVDAEQQTIDKLMVILSVFMAHAKINEHARAEIMLMLTGVKTYTGDLAEIVEKVTETVEAATVAEEKIETPVLDEIEAGQGAVAENKDAIVVGGL